MCGSADGKACEACPSCQQYYLGLTADAKTIRLESSDAPVDVFSVAKQRERDRDLQFIAQGTVFVGFASALRLVCCAPQLWRQGSVS